MGLREDFERAWPVIKEAPVPALAIMAVCAAIGFGAATLLYSRQLDTAHEERDLWKTKAEQVAPQHQTEKAGPVTPQGKALASDGRTMLVDTPPPGGTASTALMTVPSQSVGPKPPPHPSKPKEPPKTKPLAAIAPLSGSGKIMFSTVDGRPGSALQWQGGALIGNSISGYDRVTGDGTLGANNTITRGGGPPVVSPPSEVLPSPAAPK